MNFLKYLSHEIFERVPLLYSSTILQYDKKILQPCCVSVKKTVKNLMSKFQIPDKRS